jgi:regulation of enolase protein 1 (concanavalin A-like superfamily)
VDLVIAGHTFTTDSADVWTFADPTLTGVAGPRTDLFVDPATGEATHNAPRLLTVPPPDDWQLSARVSVRFAGTFDAGALLLRGGADQWAKLAFERSPQGDGMVVTVVTRGRSDDANGYIVDGEAVWLRISHLNGAYACHASLDGVTWDFVRHFVMDSMDPAQAQVGFEVQSPMGEGCQARFTDIALASTTLADLRDGR